MNTIKYYEYTDHCPVCGSPVHLGDSYHIPFRSKLGHCSSCGLIYHVGIFQKLLYKIGIAGREEKLAYKQKLKDQGLEDIHRKIRREFFINDVVAYSLLAVLLVLITPFAILAYVLGYGDLD